MQIPGRRKAQRQICDPDISAVAHIDQPAPDSVGNGLGLLIFFNLIAKGSDVFLKVLGLNLGAGLCKEPSAAYDASAASDHNVFTVIGCIVIELSKV